LVAVLAPLLSQRVALRLTGIARSTWHYRQHPRARVADPVPHRMRRSDHWLGEWDELVIVAWLTAEQWLGTSIGELFIIAWDAGVYVGSRRSWYRVAARHGLPHRPPRRMASYPPRAIPVLLATAPNQVWSWDITKLATRFQGQTFEFYVVLDLFSRYVVAYRVETRECDELAREMFAEAFARHQVRPQVVHSDGGAAMTSKSVQQLFTDLAISPSRNRPRVCNDNPFSEAWFKTAKYHPSYPEEFATLQQARDWAGELIGWYNQQHRHSGIAWHTPISVFDGNYRKINRQRQTLLDDHYAANPKRYTRPPKTPQVPIEAWINDPRRQPKTEI
jgi:putative transposase